MSKEEMKELEHFLCRQAEFTEELEWIKEARSDPQNNLNTSILDTEIACNTRILEILKIIIAQRASASAIKRLVDSRQVIVDPTHRHPEIEERIAKRSLKG